MRKRDQNAILKSSAPFNKMYYKLKIIIVSEGKRFKLTRFGRMEKIHPKVLEIHTATLARKQFENKNVKEDLTLEVYIFVLILIIYVSIYIYVISILV